jgi:cold shock CspA family protein
MREAPYEPLIESHALRRRGIVANWNDDRGYGFIRPLDFADRRSVFVHRSSLPSSDQSLAVGARISFTMGISPINGRDMAVDVQEE